MQKTAKKILIIGAGMGGLGLALALQRIGIVVKVFEAAPQLAEIGAGLSLSPNATHALNYMGLGEFLEQSANRPNDAVMMHYKSGEILARNSLDNDFKQEFGAEYYQIHRADMHAGLVARVLANDPDSIYLGHQFTGFEQDDSSVTARFANGQRASGTVLIGADGIRSTLRSILFTEAAPLFTGQVAYRATLDAQGLERFTERADSSVTVGPGHIFVRYLIRHNELLNVVAIAQSDAWKEEGWSTPASRAELLAEHRGWNEQVIGLIEAAPDNAFYKWALFDREPLSRWTFDRVTLLGDAAHPMLPFLGMGAAMAFEDAVVLARCIEANDDIERAFMHYEKVRKARTDDVFQASRNHGKVLQTSDPDQVNWSEIETENDWTFFGYNPVTVEI